MDKTSLFSAKEIESALIHKTLSEVYEALVEKGYNPVSQIVGYIISGDPGYISSHCNARTKITKFDRAVLLTEIIKSYLE